MTVNIIVPDFAQSGIFQLRRMIQHAQNSKVMENGFEAIRKYL